ncbi:MAG TPA: hypothetical protein VGO47_05925 [Chlamydiales bacterium]|nr:hypothetical protein [Chlamydiales bacterium]
MIKEINKDYAKTILPSWVSAGPSSFDHSGHGKPSAYELRVTGLVRLAISLPRLWGGHANKQYDLMLENFMHLLNAVHHLSTRTVIPSLSVLGSGKATSQLYCGEYQCYLQGHVELYPTGKIQPMEHIMYHQGNKLDLVGPLYAHNTNLFECYNGILQNTSTNMCFGMFHLRTASLGD